MHAYLHAHAVALARPEGVDGRRRHDAAPMRQSMTRPTRAELARHAPALACYFFLTLAVESSTTPLALVRNRALAWDETPEGANRFYAFVFAVATLKPLYASVSDRSRARGGTRAAHVALGCAVALAGALGSSAARTTAQTYGFGTLASAGAAHAYASLDGYVVERFGGEAGRSRDDVVMAQACAMAARTAGSVVGDLASAGGLAAASARTAAAASGIWMLVAIAVAVVSVDESDISRDVDSGREDERKMESRSCASWTARAKEAYAPLAEVDFLRCAALVFLYRIAPTALDTFASYTYAVFSDRMKDYEFGLVAFFTSLGALAAPAAFGWAFGDASASGSSVGENDAGTLTKIRALLVSSPTWMMFVFGAVVDAALGLCRLFIVWRPPATGAVAALSIVNALAIFGLRVGYMPIVTLGAIMAPQNLEAVGFAALIFASDVGALVSAYVSAGVVRALHIGAPTRTDTTGAVIPTDRSWSPLTAFLVLVAACKIIIPCVSAPPLLSSASRRSRAADFSLLPADADRSHATVDDAARDSNASTRPSSSPFDLASPSAEL